MAKAVKAKLRMLSDELKALRAVKRASIKAGRKILKSHLFMGAKYLASGEFEEMKAWLVADGRDQYVDLYPNKSSPMVAVHSVFMVLGMVAAKPWRVAVVKFDIKGVLIQIPMMGEPTYMKLHKDMTCHVVSLFPELEKDANIESNVRMYSSECIVVCPHQEGPGRARICC
jgi:hypothetical protein